MKTIRIAMAEVNPTVGALAANAELIAGFAARAADSGADVVLFPELALTGYPPEDLLHRPAFIARNLGAIEEVAASITGVVAVVGFVDRVEDRLFNAAAIIAGGRVLGVAHKMKLPNYGVFDEQRYFTPGLTPLVFTLGGVGFGVGICEDIWHPEGPVRAQARAGASVILNINASPYQTGKYEARERVVSDTARSNNVAVAYCNMVGGQDELVFDGRGMVAAPDGRVIARSPGFGEDLIVTDIEARPFESRKGGADGVEVMALPEAAPKKRPAIPAPAPAAPVDPRDEVLSALKLGTRDYVRKNGFSHVVIAVSGGIDSALVAAIATEALGPEYVTAVFMPSQYSADISRIDADLLAANLGIELKTIPIEGPFESYLSTLAPVFEGTEEGIAEENIQARIRGNLIMAMSNKFGWLVLTTGNKSEMSVGYATLYGDMAGGFAVIKDVPKTMVYELSKRINERAGREIIPVRTITRPPSAELRPDQTDQDSLPPYDVLDGILKAYIEEHKGYDEILGMGFDAETTGRVIRLVDLSEYKRRQAPPGVKITPRAFGKDRRMPITNGFRPGGSKG